MRSSTFPQLAAWLAFLAYFSSAGARPVVSTASSPVALAQPDSGTCEMPVLPHNHRIEEHGGRNEDWDLLYHEPRTDGFDDSEDLEAAQFVDCDQAIVMNDPKFGAGDLDYVEELEQEKARWIADQVYMRQADVIQALQDQHVLNGFGEKSQQDSSRREDGYLDRTKQVIQGLICLLPEKAKYYTTCPKSASEIGSAGIDFGSQQL
ncbi:hypothetical protein V1517DRAFT_314631 [Lipomyces orientalis]|uniref:Uncharacterized protein n=1 Tax=Lipomyces orientalis TaxID=1233043 RepID=A0ACC3TVV2_9ASCO